MNVLNSKPQINLKNHISNKNKGESIRYCPKITVPNTLALSAGGGDGSRTNSRRSIVKNRNFQAENVALLWAEILHIEPHPVP